MSQDNLASTLLELRTKPLNQATPNSNSNYVLCWLMQALRAADNPLVDAAIKFANDRGLPVVVLQTLDNRYPYASARIHQFMLEASVDLEAGLSARNLRFVRYVRTSADMSQDAPGTLETVTRLAAEATAVFVDNVPLFVTHDYATRLAATLPVPVFAVDACCLVPMNALIDPLTTTPAFRKAHSPLRAQHIEINLTQVAEVASYQGSFDIEMVPADALGKQNLAEFITSTHIDMSVPASSEFHGSRTAALTRLDHAVEHIIPRYKWTRNNPALDGTAKLSPWLHFGVLSAREVSRKVLDAEANHGLHSAARYKFLDELLTWREYYYHQARHNPAFSTYAGLPEAARDTLEQHRGDPRRHIYSLNELMLGQTDDALWNASQRQFLLDGWMHNNVRMYWVKQFLKWTDSPERAFASACYLNDRLSLDGRDPSTYGGIRWGFGDGRPYKEMAIYGTVSRKTSSALMKRQGVATWIEQMNARPLPDISAPDEDMLTRYM
jgi:photolyase PhrII